MRNTRRLRASEIQSSSMADVTFILLVFFLLVTTVSMDQGLNIVLPELNSEPRPVPTKNLTNIYINQAGNVLFGDTQIRVRDIKSKAEALITENENMIFSIQAHKATKYQVYINVLDQLKLANTNKISIADPQ